MRSARYPARVATTTETDPDQAAHPRAPALVEAAELAPIDPDAYEVLGEIARGGMGRILRARDRRLDRIVAIKQLLVATPRLIALFEREVRITARLQHPSIVGLYEAGTLPGGELVYAMRLVPGRALREVLRAPRSLPDRLTLLPMVIAVADALAYAHQQQVIHRDLKPGNVLVGEFGEVVVIDWGLARELGAPDDEAPVVADDAAPDDVAGVTAGAEGTPAYMAPEAARGELVDARADVYAIGAILYEALTGAPPYRGASGRAVRAAVRAGPPAAIEARAPGVPADLAAIIGKAMARQPADRYPTARELADELRRFQAGQLVSAHAYSYAERVARWVRKQRAPVAVAAVAVAVVVTLVAIGVTRIVRERDLAADRADRLTLAQARLQVDADPEAALATLATLPPGSRYWGAARMIAAEALDRGVAEAVAADGEVVAVGVDGATARVVTRVAGELRLGGREPAAALAGSATPAAIAVAADARTVAAIVDGEVRVWRAGEPAPILRRPAPRASPHLAVAADGSAVAVAGRDAGVIVWRLRDGAELLRDELARDVVGLAVAGEARTVALIRARSVELRGATARTLVTAAEVLAAALTVDGDTIAVATADGVVRVDASAGGAEVLLRHDAPVRLIALGAGARVIVTAAERVIRIWGRDGVARAELRGHRGDVTALAIGDDGGTVVSADATGARRWALARGDVRWTGPVSDGVSLVAEGARVIEACADGSIWQWDGAAEGVRLGAHVAAARAVALTAAEVISGGDDGTVRAWGGAQAARVVGAHRGPVRTVAVNRGGDAIVTGGDDRTVRLWSAGAAGGRALGSHGARVLAVGFGADGRQVISIGDEATAWVWDLAGAAPRALALPGAASALALGAHGEIGIGTRTGEVLVWRGATAAVVARHTAPVRELAFGPDGRVASVGDDGQVVVARRGAAPVVLTGHDDFVTAVAWSAAGALASGGEDGTVRLWDVATGEARVLRAEGWIADLAFVDAGATVIAIGAGGAVQRWRDDLPREPGALRAVVQGVLARGTR